METCNLEPFRYPSVPQPESEAGASGAQINEQSLEEYLARFQAAVCADLTALEARIAALEALVVP